MGASARTAADRRALLLGMPAPGAGIQRGDSHEGAARCQELSPREWHSESLKA